MNAIFHNLVYGNGFVMCDIREADNPLEAELLLAKLSPECVCVR